MSTAPVIYIWDGEAMRPLPRFLPLCNRQFVFGERYRLSEHEDRSAASHGHYFARLHEIWDNLPEHYATQFPSVERMRKWALCRTAYRVEKKIACVSKQEALRMASFISQTSDDDYAEIAVHGRILIKVTAQSQSYKAMGRKKFEDSKQQVLDILTPLIGVTPQQLAENAGRAA